MRRAAGRGPVSRPRVAFTPVALAALPLLLAAAPPPAAPPPADAIPPVSSLPRLRPLWSTPGLSEIPSMLARTPVSAGIALTWAFEKPSTLVAIDLRTGKQRWRLPMPNEYRPEIVLAGDLALVYRSIGATAVDLATGQQRWTRRQCFRSDLATIAKPHVGVGMCTAPEPPADERDDRPRLIYSKNMAVAIDLDTGRELWRVPTGWPSEALAAAGGLFYVAADTAQFRQKSVTVSALDPRTGNSLRSFTLPHVPNRIRILPGDPTRALFVGDEIVAVDLKDGRVLWQAAGPAAATQMTSRVPWPELSGGRVLAWNGNHLRELDLRTGADAATWDAPARITSYGSQTVRIAASSSSMRVPSGTQPLSRWSSATRL